MRRGCTLLAQAARASHHGWGQTPHRVGRVWSKGGALGLERSGWAISDRHAHGMGSGRADNDSVGSLGQPDLPPASDVNPSSRQQDPTSKGARSTYPFKKAPSVPHLAEMVKAHPGELDDFHLAAALTRLAMLQREQRVQANGRQPREQLRAILLRALVDKVEPSAWRPRSAATAAAALAESRGLVSKQGHLLEAAARKKLAALLWQYPPAELSSQVRHTRSNFPRQMFPWATNAPATERKKLLATRCDALSRTA